MKRGLSALLVLLLIFSCVLTGSLPINASTKADKSRSIAIVFDNSGSMYYNGEQAWCRATYAMEVFASMLNEGDTLLIYPMHPVTVDGKEYTMESPYRITESAKASTIRDMYTSSTGGTPIESVDYAIQDLQAMQAEKKYMIVLTDGNAFYKNGYEMSKDETRRQLDSRFQAQAGKTMTVMYLGIGNDVVMPGTAQSEYFVKRQAKNSTDVLSALTEMCNLIFGRDTLPKNRLSGQTVQFDISMSKLIVFVQGENLSNLKVTGSSGLVGKQLSVASTKYGTAGCGNYKSVPDTSLQGMMVTYADCPAGTYTINYDGTATSVEVYYEPNADLDFVFTDAAGKTVNPDALYEGEYLVSFGMKDANTGKLISSDLLGDQHYRGSYYINGQEYPFTHDGNNGQVPVKLSMNDTFNAKLMVTYLSGYTISKDSSDFGWPDFGLHVNPRPPGDLKLVISGGANAYSVQELPEGTPYIAKVYYQDKQLTGEALKQVELKWDADTSHADIRKTFADDHYQLTLHYKDPTAPQETICGSCTVTIHAFYTEEGSKEANTHESFTYNIQESELKLEISGGEETYSMQFLEGGAPFIAKVYYQGKQLTGEELRRVSLEWIPDISNAEIKQEFSDDHYKLTLHHKDPSAPQNTTCGECVVPIYARYLAESGYETETEDTVTYCIEADLSVLQIELDPPQNYIVIGELAESPPIVVHLQLNGAALAEEDFDTLDLQVDCSGINYTATACKDDSTYLIQLLPTDGIAEGDYSIRVNALYKDHIEREFPAEDSTIITLSKLPLWVKWMICLLLLLIILLIILFILHIKVLPKYAHVTKKDSTLIFDGEDETKSTTFSAKIEKGQMVLHSKYAGTKTGLTMNVKSGRESYLRKSQTRRSAEVKSDSVKKLGTATIHEATIGSIKYVMNEDTGKLERVPKSEKPFDLRHGTKINYSGTMLNAGIAKPFTVTTKLNFKKK